MFSPGGRRTPGLATPTPFSQGTGLGETDMTQSFVLSRLWISLPTGSANNLWLHVIYLSKAVPVTDETVHPMQSQPVAP